VAAAGAAARLSGVGKPDEGSVTLLEAAARGGAVAAGRGAPGAAGRGGGGGRTPSVLHVLSSDGMFHTMYVSNGDAPQAPVRFLPANSNAQGLIVVDNIAYAATTQGCGGAPNGVWALDLASKEITSWTSNSGIAGSAGAAFGPDGTLFVATSDGDLVSLEPKTLKVKDAYKAGGFTATPVVFEYKEKTLIAAAGKDGYIYLLDGTTRLYKTPTPLADFAPGALAGWQDAGGTRWILAAAKDSVVAWKMVDHNGALGLEPGWTSRVVSPLPPMVINGVIFAVSSGAQRSTPAVVYALDAATGKELWNSGKTITSFAHGGGLSAGGSQVYLGTYDGTLYAFGFPIEH
jgi:outer membrane protein assembly factor BamB